MIDLSYRAISAWLNGNQGVLAVGIFVTTLLFGWVTGIFASLRRKPKLKIEAIPGPTFVCTYGIGQRHEGFDAHRTGIALYLKIANIGSASTSLEDVWVGYRWSINPRSKLWWKYGLFRFWITHQTVALEDFQVDIGGDNTKIYPFLTQVSSLSSSNTDTFLEVGKSANGVVYFEQGDSFGGCFPFSVNNQVNFKIVILDVYGKKHRKRITVPKVKLAEARRYNPSFGMTLTLLNEGKDVFDLPTDQHGNLIPPTQD